MQKTILVLGGTGMLGQPAARRLREAGFRVRIMTRSPQKAAGLFDSAYEIFAGDPLDAACLEEALQGCAGVHISLPNEAELPAAQSVAQIAPRHGIERITYISGATVAEANRWFAMVDHKYRAEQAIMASGVPYTLLCPTWIMESLGLFVMQGRASMLGRQPLPYHWVAADDLAGLVAEAYQAGDAANGRMRVFGPEAITMREALHRYCAALHPEIETVSAMPFWVVRLLAGVTRNAGLKAAGEMMAYFEKVGEGDSTDVGDDILDAPTTTLDQWLAAKAGQNAAVAA